VQTALEPRAERQQVQGRMQRAVDQQQLLLELGLPLEL
jgi:hypothetical protein